MRLLVTRPAEDAAALIERLREIGHEAIASPVLEIVARGEPPTDWGRYSGLVFTSRHAITALGVLPEGALALPVWTVGEATAARARFAGFKVVRSAGGTEADLAALLAAKAQRDALPLLHLRGQETRGGLARPLRDAGLTLEARIVYEARPLERLTPEAAAAIANHSVNGVLVFSPRSARLFVDLATGSGVSGGLSHLTGYCISEATAAALGGSVGAAVVAPLPELDSLLDVVSRQTL